MQRLMGIAIAALLARETFAGALRYILDRSGLGAAWFLFDLLLMAAVAYVVTDHFIGRTRTRYFQITLIIGFYLLLGVGSGFAHGNNVASIFSAIKIAMPLIASLILYPRYLETPAFRAFLALLLICGVGGLFYNHFHEMPWTGLSISQFGVERQASRQWWANGESRLAGLGQASSASATTILLVALLLARGVRRFWLKLGIYAGTAVAVSLTISTTPLIALYAAILVDLWPPRFGRIQGYDRVPLFMVMLLATVTPLLFSMIVIFSDGIAHYRDSFMDRLHFTWPSVLTMNYDAGGASFIFGQGFGSIGSPAYYSGKYISPTSAVDNFIVYMIALFGVFAIFIAIVVVLSFLAVPWWDRNLAFAAGLLMAAISCEGVSGALLVGFSIALGLGASDPHRLGASRVRPGTPSLKRRGNDPPGPATGSAA
jgi:hypothetical protein